MLANFLSNGRGRWGRPEAVGLAVALGVVLVACDGALPTQPTDLGPGPTPGSPARRSTGPIAFVSNRDGTDSVYLANEDGSNVTALVVGGGPAWARDGRQIAFHVGGEWAVHAIGVDGSGRRFVTAGRSAAWSPDGRALVFESWDAPDLEIGLVNPDGSGRRPLFDSGGYGSFRPKWSPDGRQIVFSVGTWVDVGLGLWIMNSDGSAARPLGSDNLWDAWAPSWSPDGSEIAFASDAGIEVVRTDGSDRRVRVSGPAFDPEWTPDGRLIYTKGTFGGSTRIFINDGGTDRQLIPDASAPASTSYGDGQAVWLR